MDAWEELEALAGELEAANEEWSKTAASLRQQTESFTAVTSQIEQHYRDLAVDEALLAIAGRALADSARLHTARLNFGLTRSTALVWYPIDDPRPDLCLAPPEGQYTIEVRIGPRYLLGVQGDKGGAGDQRVSIVIAGAKQLVATLPTTAEKFRSALLAVFRAPGYSGPPREQPNAEAAAGTDEGASGDRGDESAAAGEAPTGEAGAEAAGAPDETAAQQATPGEDTVIELPGASETPETKPRRQRGRRTAATAE